MFSDCHYFHFKWWRPFVVRGRRRKQLTLSVVSVIYRTFFLLVISRNFYKKLQHRSKEIQADLLIFITTCIFAGGDLMSWLLIFAADSLKVILQCCWFAMIWEGGAGEALFQLDVERRKQKSCPSHEKMRRRAIGQLHERRLQKSKLSLRSISNPANYKLTEVLNKFIDLLI